MLIGWGEGCLHLKVCCVKEPKIVPDYQSRGTHRHHTARYDNQ